MATVKLEYKVFIASPGDVGQARDAVDEAVHEWNSLFSDHKQALLSPRRWELHAPPADMAHDSQDLINQALVEPADVVVAVFSTRLGEYTREELLLAARLRKPLCIYHEKHESVDATAVLEFARLVDYLQEEHHQHDVVKPYRDVDGLKRLLLHDLTAVVDRLLARDAPHHVDAPIIAYSGERGDFPPEHTAPAILQALQRGHRLVVVGRTCRRWFVGAGDDEAARLQNLMRAAVKRGAHIEFVVQDLHYEYLLPEFDELRRHLSETAQSYAVTRSRLSETERVRLSLRYSRQPIVNSRLLLYDEQRRFSRLQFDLAMDYERKPYAVIRDQTFARHSIEETERILRNAMSEAEHEYVRRKRQDQEFLITQIRRARDEHPGYLPQRRNAPERLVRHAARWETALERRVDDIPPPISIQLLLTNACVTHCAMCDHYRMRNQRAELRSPEIEALLEEARDMGVNSIILSGGEPLRHKDFAQNLAHCSKLGLKVGILTSGLLPESTSHQHRERVFDAIASHAAWVQLSIDSFDAIKYAAIRRHGALNQCTEFVNALKARAFRELEICCTVQKHNYDELISADVFDRMRQLFADVRVRFKFAHGTWGRSFLLSEEQVLRLLSAWNSPQSAGETWTNAHSIASIVSGDLERATHISQGAPARKALRELNGRHPCYALRATLFVDAHGDVYPCCYLFNDNLNAWEPRARFKVGSWRDERANGDGNALSRIWRGLALAELRRQQLPVLPEACERCTRHVEQNRFWAKLHAVFDEHRRRVAWPGYRLEDDLLGLDDPSADTADGLWL